MSNRESRIRLFDFASSILRQSPVIELPEDLEEVYFCPICMRGFEKKSAETGDELTLEHFPPEAVGAQGETLTCRDCNSHAGHEIDSEMDSRRSTRKFLDALVGEGTWEGRVKLDSFKGVELNVDAELQEDGPMIMEINPDINDPDVLERYEEVEDAQELDEKSITLSPVKDDSGTSTSHHPFKAKVGDLASAYLAMFSLLGYKYAFHENLDPVREQIVDPHKEKMDLFHADLGQEADNSKHQIFLMQADFSYVHVRLGRDLINLPWHAEEYDDVYKKIEESGQLNDVNVKQLPWPDTLVMSLDKENTIYQHDYIDPEVFKLLDVEINR